MSKGLDALKECRNLVGLPSLNEYQHKLDIVEKELKEYEEMKAIKGTTTFDKAVEDTLVNACPNIAKKLKALEIILRLPIKLIPETEEEFGELACGLSRIIIDEKYEYDLLKEVLNSGNL